MQINPGDFEFWVRLRNCEREAIILTIEIVCQALTLCKWKWSIHILILRSRPLQVSPRYRNNEQSTQFIKVTQKKKRKHPWLIIITTIWTEWHFSSWTFKSYSRRLQPLRQSDCTPFSLELNCSGILVQAGGCSAERTAPGWFHPPCTSHLIPYKCTVRSQNQVIFKHWLAGVQKLCLMQVFESTCFNWIAHGNFHSRISLLEVCLSQVISRAVIGSLSASVNPKGERCVVRLAEWLLTLSAQDVISLHWGLPPSPTILPATCACT
jgi:hypothetical protein